MLGIGAFVVALALAASPAGCSGDGETSVGEVTKVVKRKAFVGQTLVRRGNKLFANGLLTTNNSGTVEFELGSGTNCQTRRNSKLKIEPGGGIRIHFLKGESLCAKKPDAGRTTYLIGETIRVTADDPVFVVAVDGEETVVRVTLGFVEVKTRAAREPIIIGPQQQAVVSYAERVPRLEKSELSAGEAVITDALARGLPPNDSAPPANLEEIAEEDVLVLAADPFAPRSVRSFIGGFARSLDAKWDVRTRIESLQPDEAQRRLQEKTVDIVVSPAKAMPASAAVPFFTRDGTTWSLTISPDADFERSLSDFVTTSLLTGEYRRLYVDSFGSEPKYTRANGSFLVDVGRAPAGTLFSTLPADQMVEAAGPDGTPVPYDAPEVRTQGLQASVNCSPPPGSLFPIGTKTVTCTAQVPGGVEERASFRVTVRDTSEPTLNIRGAVEHEADAKDGATVKFAITASDQVDGVFEATCTPASGERFSIGTHDVTCTATDDAGNSERGSFKVTVIDEAPVLKVPPNVSRPYASPSGTRVVYRRVSAHDAVDGTLPPACNRRSGSLFPVGTTTVRCSATDSAGQRTERSFKVEIVDRVPPLLTVPSSHAVSAPAGARTHVVTFVTSAVDAVDGTVPVECDPESGSKFLVGETTHVSCTATDHSGNVADEQFSVAVSSSSR